MYNDRENSLASEIIQEQRDLEDLKSLQYIGKKSITNYKTFSADAYDLDFVIVNADTIRNFTVTFTYDDPNTDALLSLNVYTRADNSDVMANPIPYFSPTAPEFTTRWKKDVPITQGQTVWYVQFIKNLPGFPSFHVYAKVFIDGTATGTWNIVEV